MHHFQCFANFASFFAPKPCIRLSFLPRNSFLRYRTSRSRATDQISIFYMFFQDLKPFCAFVRGSYETFCDFCKVRSDGYFTFFAKTPRGLTFYTFVRKKCTLLFEEH